jgi:hypothetical protein
MVETSPINKNTIPTNATNEPTNSVMAESESAEYCESKEFC